MMKFNCQFPPFVACLYNNRVTLDSLCLSTRADWPIFLNYFHTNLHEDRNIVKNFPIQSILYLMAGVIIIGHPLYIYIYICLIIKILNVYFIYINIFESSSLICNAAHM